MTSSRLGLGAALVSAVIAGATNAGAAIGAMRSIQILPGFAGAKGPEPRRAVRRMQVQESRQHAAQAKRLKRQERNLRWHARGAYGRR